jgi:hypothetical protein
MKKTVVGAVAVGVGAPLVALALSVSQAAPASAKPDGTGPCSSACGVGASGQGGVAGNAQGEYFKGPSGIPDTTIRFIGSANSGRLDLRGAVEGSASGHIHNPQLLTGHQTGAVSPNPDGSPCNGRCPVG